MHIWKECYSYNISKLDILPFSNWIFCDNFLNIHFCTKIFWMKVLEVPTSQRYQVQNINRFLCNQMKILRFFRTLIEFSGRTTTPSWLSETKIKFMTWTWRSYVFIIFYAPPHNSGGVLWFHVGRPCPSIRLSVVCPSVRFSFPDDNLSKHQWIFTKRYVHWYCGYLIWDC